MEQANLSVLNQTSTGKYTDDSIASTFHLVDIDAVWNISLADILSWTNQHLPGWILDTATRFRDDQAQTNWKNVCDRLHTAPTKILIVEDVCLDDPKRKSNILQALCNRLTMAGYCVRDQAHVGKCTHCEVVEWKIKSKLDKVHVPFEGLCRNCMKDKKY